MFAKFEAAFFSDRGTPLHHLTAGVRVIGGDHIDQFFLRYGGCSFGDGIYRVVTRDSTERWTRAVTYAFPAFTGRLNVFGFDWLGRAFAIDSKRLHEGMGAIVLLEPGTGQALEIPQNIEGFHNDELVNFKEEALAASFLEQWRDVGGQAPSFSQCIGYKVPLFLGGSDTVDNLVVSDLDVYWSVSSQLLEKLRVAAT